MGAAPDEVCEDEGAVPVAVESPEPLEELPVSDPDPDPFPEEVELEEEESEEEELEMVLVIVLRVVAPEVVAPVV